MKKKKMVNGVLSLIISQFIVKIFGLVYKVYLANKSGFGDSGNAIYNSGFQIYALLLTVSSIGVPNAVAKLVAEKYYAGNKMEIAKIIKSSLVVFSILGIVFSVGLAIFSEFISKKVLNIHEAKYSLIILAPAIFNVCLISVYRGLYNGTRNINITAKSQTLEQIFKTALTIALVEIFYYVSNCNTVAMATVANGATTIATLFCLVYLSKNNNICNVKVKISFRTIYRVLKVSIPISLSAILASLNRNIDSVTIVRFLKSQIGEVAAKVQYGMLCGKIEIIAALPASFVIAAATTIIPSISMQNARNNKKEVVNIFCLYFLFIILMVLPCSIGMFFFSDQILTLLFGSSTGSILFKINAITVFFVSIEQIINATLHGIGKIFVPTFSLLVGVIIKIMLNIVLLKIPNSVFFCGGITGACIATLACHIIASFISFCILNKNLKIKLNFLKYILKPIFSSCIMLMCLSYSYLFFKGIIFEKVAIILAITLASLAYILSIFVLKILNREELLAIPFLSNFMKFNKK